MSINKGNDRRFYISNSTHSSTDWLAGEQSNSFNRSAEFLDTSDKSSDWQTGCAGRKSAQADVTVHLDDTASAGQHELLDSFHDGDEVYCFIGKVTTSGSTTTMSEGDFFKGIITAINDTQDKDGVASRQISIQVVGEPTHYPNFS